MGMRLEALWVPLIIALGAMRVDGGVSQVKLKKNGYEGVVIAISGQVDEREGPSLIKALKELVRETSQKLFNATKRRAYFRKVSILIPRSWNQTLADDIAINENFQDSDIRVDTPNFAYENQPYTPPRGCERPGHFIHLTPDYVQNYKVDSWNYGPGGTVLLREWAKLRWGVYDEVGYEGDDLFPPLYFSDLEKYLPTLCSDKHVEGEPILKKSLEACPVDANGKPDKNCIFRAALDQQASSSLMSYPTIFSDTVVDFCDDKASQHPHNEKAPTKQNYFCNSQSVWEVMRKHEDFANDTNLPTNPYKDPEIRVVQQADANYALVLDYSGSMKNYTRIDLLKNATHRWLLYEVAEGSHVAIVRFSKTADLLRGLTNITDEASRNTLARSIQQSPEGGTSIGSGLKYAREEVLSGRRNPVILLITDGEENEDPRISDELPNIINSGVRVITVAFGGSADKNLEKLARETGGKSFTVNDNEGGHMMDDAFVAALAYQPPPSVLDTTVVIYEEDLQSSDEELQASFDVDFTIGRNLKMQLHADDPEHIPNAPYLIRSDGSTKVENAVFDRNITQWTITCPKAEEGEWKLYVKVPSSGIRIHVKVTAQTRDSAVLPIIATGKPDSRSIYVNAATDRVLLTAIVQQGNNAVINATVRALVTPPNGAEYNRVIDLWDGKGPDQTAGDGIYSRYMTQYAGTGRYNVKFHVSSDGAWINGGRRNKVNSRRKRGVEEKPKYCCGSVVPFNPEYAENTGRFKRIASGGSIQVIHVPDTDVMPPDRVRDFRVVLVDSTKQNTSHDLVLTWTAPGDDLDSGTVSDYKIRVSSNISEVLQEEISPESSDVVHNIRDFGTEEEVFLEAGEKVTVNVTFQLNFDNTIIYYLTLQAIDEVGLKSLISNVAFVERSLPPTVPENTLLPVWAIVIIITLILIAAVIITVVLLIRRKVTHGEFVLVATMSQLNE